MTIKKSDWKKIGCLAVMLALFGCGEKQEAAKEKNDDPAKKAVRSVIRREFDYYEGAKQKLGEAEKHEQERREREKQLDQ